MVESCVRFKSPEALPADHIEPLFRDAFTQSEGEAEGRMIGALARALLDTTPSEDLRVYLAEEGDELVGAIIVTRLTFEDPIEAFIVAPVATHPDWQRRGIAQGLLRCGINDLRKAGVQLLMTYGDPAFYGKVGFKPVSPDAIQPPCDLSQPIGWIGQSLTGGELPKLDGRCSCVEALADQRYW